jgi:phage tail-like protein
MAGSFPHVNSYFAIQIDGLEVGRFSECSGISLERKFTEHRAGGMSGIVYLPEPITYGRVTLKRGVDAVGAFYEWFMGVNGMPERKNVSIVVYDRDQNEVRRWNLSNAMPAKWTGPPLSAESAAVMVESLELVYENLLPT